MKSTLTHLDEHGAAHMVDITGKKESLRRAVAVGSVSMAPKTLRLILEGQLKKGDVFGSARLAGIMAAKQTAHLIPLCHPLPLSHIEVRITAGESCLHVEAEACVRGRTGVEMEALTAVTIGCLTIYDMAKAVDKGMRIEDIHLVKKTKDP